jgi:uncharacterized membrane protein YccC
MRLAVRVVVAGVATFALAHLLGLSQGYWAVITAVIVMQASVGGSVMATVERLIGTFAGAVYGGFVDVVVPHSGATELGVALAIALAPLALVAAIYPSFRVAPVTAIIVLLTPSAGTLTPLQFTIDRILEIALGSIVGLAVSLAVLPARAHSLVAQAASRMYALLGQLLPMSLAGLATPPDRAAVLKLQARIRGALARLETVAAEAKGERAGHLTDDPDPDPLVRTSMRLRHDLVMLIRASGEPMAAPIHARLSPALERVSAAGASFLAACAAALAARNPPPPLQPFADALEAYRAELEALRRDGMTRGLPGDVVGRLFAVGFALEQMRQDFGDLESRIAEFARPRPAGTAA